MVRKPVVSIYTQAFNVEKYIEECVESVLSQTMIDFEWIILDNGSTDGTSEILKCYEAHDERIRLFKNEANSVLHDAPINPECTAYWQNLDTEYFCTVDADDYLHTDFLKDLYLAGKEFDSDIVVGGAELFVDGSPELRQVRCPSSFTLNDVRRLADIFPQIYGLFRPMWGKLFKVSLLNKQVSYRLDCPVQMKTSGDTMFCLDCLRLSNSICSVPEVRYYYRVRQSSLYHSSLSQSRFIESCNIYRETLSVLNKWGQATPTNVNFAQLVFYLSVKDYINIIGKAAGVSADVKIDNLQAIVTHRETQEILRASAFEDDWYNDVLQVLEMIERFASKYERMRLTDYYLYRLYKAWSSCRNQESTHYAVLLCLSGLLDKQNTTYFGTRLLLDVLNPMDYPWLSKYKRLDVKDFEGTLSANKQKEFPAMESVTGNAGADQGASSQNVYGNLDWILSTIRVGIEQKILLDQRQIVKEWNAALVNHDAMRAREISYIVEVLLPGNDSYVEWIKRSRS
jgi:glycosyltransferase involved in cell wall biosynthesis